ncbi:glycosyltransferase family 4 protein [Pelagibacteraceae bacterium]|nr:glycosyltransferase family 4 protein [Pelagibacteraceae bacterium]
MTQYFWPENFIINDIARKLKEKNIEIDILTANPSYPSKEKFRNFKKNSFFKDSFVGLNLIRIPIIKRNGSSILNLFLNYISYIINGIFLYPIFFNKIKSDIIFVYLPSPLLSALPAIVLRFIFRVKVVLWVQDLWPESITATKNINNKIILSLIEFLVKIIYRNCDLILISSKKFEKKINKYTSVPITYYPNSYEKKTLSSENEHTKEILESHFSKDFNIVFAGNIGSAQSMKTIVDSCSKLLKKNIRINIILFGDGSEYKWVEQQIKDKKLTNLKLAGSVDSEEINYIYEKTDALLISLAKHEIFSLTVPYKLQAYLAAGKPIIGSIDGAAAEIIKDSECGMVASAESVDELVNIIIEMSQKNEVMRNEMGERGKIYFEENFQMDLNINRLYNIFKEQII